MIEWGLVEVALEFWENAGDYPAGLEEAALLTLPLSIERLAGLDLVKAEEWLRSRNFPSPGLGLLANRPLRACLVALGGARNIILLEATDPVFEQKFSLAHEIAHFLLDYLQPRELIRGQLGPAGLEILENRRPPTLTEKIEAILAGTKLKPYRHFLERNRSYLDRETDQVEQRADRLGVELLAPWEKAAAFALQSFKLSKPFKQKMDELSRVLMEMFELPGPVAEIYARELAEDLGERESFAGWLGLT